MCPNLINFLPQNVLHICALKMPISLGSGKRLTGKTLPGIASILHENVTKSGLFYQNNIIWSPCLRSIDRQFFTKMLNMIKRQYIWLAEWLK
jgi:hypothetical protein